MDESPKYTCRICGKEFSALEDKEYSDHCLMDCVMRLRTQLELSNAELDAAKAEVERMRKAIDAAKSALLSYRFGNSSPELAEEVFEFILRMEGK